MLGPVLVKHNNDIPFMVGSSTVALSVVTSTLTLPLTAKNKFVQSVQTLFEDR